MLKCHASSHGSDTCILHYNGMTDAPCMHCAQAMSAVVAAVAAAGAGAAAMAAGVVVALMAAMAVAVSGMMEAAGLGEGVAVILVAGAATLALVGCGVRMYMLHATNGIISNSEHAHSSRQVACVQSYMPYNGSK